MSPTFTVAGLLPLRVMTGGFGVGSGGGGVWVVVEVVGGGRPLIAEDALPPGAERPPAAGTCSCQLLEARMSSPFS